MAAASNIPIVGNGDILTHYEAKRLLKKYSNVHAVMVARGALIQVRPHVYVHACTHVADKQHAHHPQPWVFQDFKQGEAWEPTVVILLNLIPLTTRQAHNTHCSLRSQTPTVTAPTPPTIVLPGGAGGGVSPPRVLHERAFR